MSSKAFEMNGKAYKGTNINVFEKSVKDVCSTLFYPAAARECVRFSADEAIKATEGLEKYLKGLAIDTDINFDLIKEDIKFYRDSSVRYITKCENETREDLRKDFVKKWNGTKSKKNPVPADEVGAIVQLLLYCFPNSEVDIYKTSLYSAISDNVLYTVRKGTDKMKVNDSYVKPISANEAFNLTIHIIAEYVSGKGIEYKNTDFAMNISSIEEKIKSLVPVYQPMKEEEKKEETKAE